MVYCRLPRFFVFRLLSAASTISFPEFSRVRSADGSEFEQSGILRNLDLSGAESCTKSGLQASASYSGEGGAADDSEEPHGASRTLGGPFKDGLQAPPGYAMEGSIPVSAHGAQHRSDFRRRRRRHNLGATGQVDIAGVGEHVRLS